MSKLRRQIVAIGCGGFSVEPNNPALDRYILKLTRKSKPRVCFVPTASGDSEQYIAQFDKTFRKLHCTVSHLSLFGVPPPDLESFLLNQDVIYVGGGNTFSMLALWREWKIDRALKKAWQQGVILAGVSAGSICWFEEGVTDSFGPLAPIECLGLIPGSHCPHYNSGTNRRPAYLGLIGKGRLKAGYAVDDGVALHFIGKRVAKIISSRPDALAYQIRRAADRWVETGLAPIFLRPSLPKRRGKKVRR